MCCTLCTVSRDFTPYQHGKLSNGTPLLLLLRRDPFYPACPNPVKFNLTAVCVRFQVDMAIVA